MVRGKWFAGSAVLLLMAGSAAMATVIPVGAGNSQAELYVEFDDGASYTFEVAFDGPMSGMGLFDAVEAATDLTTVRVFDDAFIDGVTYDGHSNVGFGGGDDWWHYWIKAPGGEWELSLLSGTQRIVTDGAADGWVYGRATPPVPEPATALLAAAAVGWIGRRRGRA